MYVKRAVHVERADQAKLLFIPRRRSHVSEYFWNRNFFFPDTPYVHTYPANSLANPEHFEYALQSGHFLIRYESETVWTPNPDIIFIWMT